MYIKTLLVQIKTLALFEIHRGRLSDTLGMVTALKASFSVNFLLDTLATFRKSLSRDSRIQAGGR